MGIMRIHPSDIPDVFYEEPERVGDGMQKAKALRRIRWLLYNRYDKRSDALFVGGYSYIMYNRNNGYDRIDPDCCIAFGVDAEAHFEIYAELLGMGCGQDSGFRAGDGVAERGCSRFGT